MIIEGVCFSVLVVNFFFFAFTFSVRNFSIDSSIPAVVPLHVFVHISDSESIDVDVSLSCFSCLPTIYPRNLLCCTSHIRKRRKLTWIWSDENVYIFRYWCYLTSRRAGKAEKFTFFGIEHRLSFSVRRSLCRLETRKQWRTLQKRNDDKTQVSLILSEMVYLLRDMMKRAYKKYITFLFSSRWNSISIVFWTDDELFP